jgi:hypothetical protein
MAKADTSILFHRSYAGSAVNSRIIDLEWWM